MSKKIAVLLVFLVAGAGEARAAGDCAALAAADFPVQMEIADAQPVPAKDDIPAYCRVRGVIAPDIGFEARLPLEGWNGKFFQSGCGGFCGTVLPDRPGQSNGILVALKRGYAAITTDAGHKASGMDDAHWAQDNPQAEEMYAHKSIPLTHKAGVALVEAFYGEGAKRSYFSGCSNGGRMAAQAAQRYPEFFDGIISGAPILNMSDYAGVFGAWAMQVNRDKAGGLVIDHRFHAKINHLAKAVMRQCGARDGIIRNPGVCRFNTELLPKCGGRNARTCYTDAERRVIAALHGGARNSAGKVLLKGLPQGSEHFWRVWFLGDGKAPAPGLALAGDYAKYLAYPQDPGGTPALDFDFDKDPPKLAAQGRLFNALNPDLSRLEKSGGKLLMWHGWADPLVLPWQAVDYYESVVREMRRRKRVHKFYRLFMVPGMGHCWEIPANAPDAFDPLTMLENWVEGGRAPHALIATQRDKRGAVVRRSVVRPYPRATLILERGK